MNKAKTKIDAIVSMYGYNLIRRGFVERDETIERALQHIGELVCKNRPTHYWPKHRLVWEGWDAVRGATTE